MTATTDPAPEPTPTPAPDEALAERLASAIHAHTCISSCPHRSSVADRNAARAVLDALCAEGWAPRPASDAPYPYVAGGLRITTADEVSRLRAELDAARAAVVSALKERDDLAAKADRLRAVGDAACDRVADAARAEIERLRAKVEQAKTEVETARRDGALDLIRREYAKALIALDWTACAVLERIAATTLGEDVRAETRARAELEDPQA